jgi:hypothetical protein
MSDKEPRVTVETTVQHYPAGEPVTFMKPDGSPLITIQIGPSTAITKTVKVKKDE